MKIVNVIGIIQIKKQLLQYEFSFILYLEYEVLNNKIKYLDDSKPLKTLRMIRSTCDI